MELCHIFAIDTGSTIIELVLSQICFLNYKRTSHRTKNGIMLFKNIYMLRIVERYDRSKLGFPTDVNNFGQFESPKADFNEKHDYALSKCT